MNGGLQPLLVDICVLEAKSDIAAQTVIDEENTLGDIPDLALPGPQCRKNFSAIDRNPAIGRLQQAEDEIDQGTFPYAGRAHDAGQMS